MVFRTFARFSRYSRNSCHIRRRGSFTCVRSDQQPFFNPSYRKPDSVVPIDEVSHRKQSRNKTNYGGFSTTVVPLLTLTKNYVIFDPSFNRRRREQEEEEERARRTREGVLGKVLLRRVSGHGSRGSRVLFNVENVGPLSTTLNIRRANSNTIHTVEVPSVPVQKRAYATKAKSTTEEGITRLEDELAKLHLTEEDVKVEIEEMAKEEAARDEIESPETPRSVKFETCVEASEQGVPDSFSQEQVIDMMMSLGKNNEALAVYMRMRGNNEIPSIKVYNKVLKSIQLRETDESPEQKLTHLLNVYSDMLSNNIRPDNRTYELVIEPLLRGSLLSYRSGEFKQGADFLKIAMELFLISHNSNSDMRFRNVSTYIELLNCVNSYKMVATATPQLFYTIIKRCIATSSTGVQLLEFYLQLIRFSALERKADDVDMFYKELRKTVNRGLLQRSQYRVYGEVISALNLCGEGKKASAMLDKVVGSLEDKTSKSSQAGISKLMSSYIMSQAWVDAPEAYKSLVRLNSIGWLPDVSVSSLFNLFAAFVEAGNLERATRVWNFTVARADFDVSMVEMRSSTDCNFMQIVDSLDQYLELLLAKQDKNMVLKTVREVVLKKSLIVSDKTLVQVLAYLEKEQYYELANAFIADQGVKRDSQSAASLNNYLSLVVDFVSSEQLASLSSTKFFKATVEQYRLVRDNVYGLIKVFKTLVDRLDESSEQLKLKLTYYTKVLNYEFNDVANFYVSLPAEIQAFKKNLDEVQRKLEQ